MPDQATELRFDTPTLVTASEVPAFITSPLDAHEFTIKPIGPEHLRVLLVEPKRSDRQPGCPFVGARHAPQIGAP